MSDAAEVPAKRAIDPLAKAEYCTDVPLDVEPRRLRRKISMGNIVALFYKLANKKYVLKFDLGFSRDGRKDVFDAPRTVIPPKVLWLRRLHPIQEAIVLKVAWEGRHSPNGEPRALAF